MLFFKDHKSKYNRYVYILKFTWYKNSKPLPFANRYETDYNLGNNICTLKINNCLKSDLGDYTVVAENPAGKDQTSCKLVLNLVPNVDETAYKNPELFKKLDEAPIKPEVDDEAKDRMRYKPPKVIVPLTDVRLSEGEPFTLECKIDGFPAPKITWFKNGELLPASTRCTPDYNLKTYIATLKVDPANLSDIGSYRCFAQNKVGQDETSCKSFVLKTPRIDETPFVNPERFKGLEKIPDKSPYDKDDSHKHKPPKFIIPLPAEHSVTNGHRLMLKPKVEGYPYPQLSWLKDNKPMLDSTRFTTVYDPYTGDIEVNVDFVKGIDTGFYILKAENPYGSDVTFMNLNVLDVPGIDYTPVTGHPDSYRHLDLPPVPSNVFDSATPDYDPENSQEIEPPKVVIPLEDTQISEMQPVILTCKITGKPSPKVFYFLAFFYFSSFAKASFRFSSSFY